MLAGNKESHRGKIAFVTYQLMDFSNETAELLKDVTRFYYKLAFYLCFAMAS